MKISGSLVKLGEFIRYFQRALKIFGKISGAFAIISLIFLSFSEIFAMFSKVFAVLSLKTVERTPNKRKPEAV